MYFHPSRKHIPESAIYVAVLAFHQPSHTWDVHLLFKLNKLLISQKIYEAVIAIGSRAFKTVIPENE